MHRSKKEQKTDVWSDKKKIPFKNIQGSEKKQDLLKIVLTCNMANHKDIQQNFFLFIFKISRSMVEGWTNKKKNEKQEI